MTSSSENQRLVAELCRSLEARGSLLIPGTGVALKDGDQVYIPPAEVHHDRLQSEDVFTFNVDFDQSGNPELNSEATNPCHNISAYTNMFLRIFQEFDCGCVIYGQPTSGFVISEVFHQVFKIKNNQLITLISNGDTKEQFPSSHELIVPIIDNPEDQSLLFNFLEQSFEKFPGTNAVLIKGNGLVVCGDTWQETKLMFETFVKLFQVAIEMKKLGAPARVTGNKEEVAESDISIVHETKPTKKVVKKSPAVVKVRPAKLATDLRTKISEVRPRVDLEAAKRKKLALQRLRDRTSGGRRIVSQSPRRSAASFMGADSSMNMNNMGMMGPMQSSMNPMNSFGSQMQFDNSSNMGYQGMNQMNMSGMNQMNMSGMNQMNMSGMNQMNMNMGMCTPGNVMMMGQNSGMFVNPVERKERTVGDRFKNSFRSSKGGRKVLKGSVKERLGFKSNITVDPELLNEENFDEEDY